MPVARAEQSERDTRVYKMSKFFSCGPADDGGERENEMFADEETTG